MEGYIAIDRDKVISAIPNINTALDNIDPNSLYIDFGCGTTNLESIVDFINVNNNDFLPLLNTFEVNLAKVLRSVGSSMEAYESMQSGIAQVISVSTENASKSCIMDS